MLLEVYLTFGLDKAVTVSTNTMDASEHRTQSYEVLDFGTLMSFELAEGSCSSTGGSLGTKGSLGSSIRDKR